MPELAEVKLMSDFINKHTDKIFTKISKSDVSKVSTNLNISYPKFKIRSKTRGKELLIEIHPLDPGEKTLYRLRVTLGMSGNWIYYKPGDTSLEKEIKHVHLYMEDEIGNRLGLSDVRRFAKWSWNNFNTDRGHDPLSDYGNFTKTVIDNYKTNNDFKKPLCEVLMNQKWFNGIGNYLRAEILDRANINPFQPASNLSLEKITDVLRLCNKCVSEAYILGGGQLKDWKNPDGTDPTSFNEWMKCYGKKESKVDSQGRRFWYDAKKFPLR